MGAQNFNYGMPLDFAKIRSSSGENFPRRKFSDSPKFRGGVNCPYNDARRAINAAVRVAALHVTRSPANAKGTRDSSACMKAHCEQM